MLRRHTRLSLPHSLHFVTTVTSARGSWFVQHDRCREVLEMFERSRAELGLLFAAYVLMPDHLHALLMQEPGFDVHSSGHVQTHAAGYDKPSTGYALPIAEFMRRIKRSTSTQCRPENYPTGVTLWHRRYDDVGVGSAHAFWTRLNYIHHNPVRKGLSTAPEEYPWSSARAFLTGEQGIVRVELDLIGSWIK